MTESVVYFLVKRIGDFLEEEIRLLSNVREEVEFVRDELERMTTFLKMADVMEQRNALAYYITAPASSCIIYFLMRSFTLVNYCKEKRELHFPGIDYLS